MPEEKSTTADLATPDAAGTALGAAPQKKPARSRSKRLPPLKLLLHNDDVNTMVDVVRSIVMLTPLSTEEAVLRMLEAHETGVSLLLTTYRERGELYVEQFASVRITTTLERDV